MSHDVTGGCLCGQVRFTATLPDRDLSVCWCSQCLRQCSGPLVCASAATKADITGSVATHRASDHATRGFCRTCGSVLFWREDRGAPSFTLGSLDQRDGYRVKEVLYAEGRPDAYDLEATS